jgi:starch-binding outer membrane protein, SusD/RagB family
MKNKNRKIFPFLMAALAMTAGSCSKDFTNKSPISTLTTANFYKTATDAEAGLVGAYNSYATLQFYVWDYMTNGEVRSDNCYAGGNNPVNFTLDNFTFNSANTNVQRNWQDLYNGIGTANAVLDNVPGINDPAWDGTNRKAQILGEAKVLRAFHYYWLVTTWGDVPLVLSSVISSTNPLYPARTAAAAVYAQMERDLQYADSVLPATVSSAEAGRVTKGTADALLAMFYAQQGNYQQCLAYCNLVLPAKFGGTGQGGYDLLPVYDNLFDNNHKNSVESLFEIQHNTGLVTYGPELLLPFSLTNDNWPKYNVGTNDLVAAFRNAGDSVRLHSTFYFGLAIDTIAVPPPYLAGTIGVPYAYKWRHADGWASTDNEILIRLADIILLKAEALNQLGQTAQAIPLINAIRTRVNLAATTASTQTDVAAAILLERRLELSLEGHRWNDLLRAGTQYTITLMNSQVDPSGNPLNYNVTPDKLIYPIPISEIQLDANLTQNPGF